MEKKRLFYLDFIRAFATIVIIITHYNALYLYLPMPTPEKAFITTKVANIYIGSFGVSLFFIISGAALMYVYQEKCELKRFYKKRFFSLFPMFWMVFAIDFLINTYLNGGIDKSIPKWKIIFSILGMDHYLTEFTTSFARVGEWFLGCIILIYLVFPLLRLGIEKKPVLTGVILMMIYSGMIYFDNGFFPLSKNLFVRFPEFVFGMLFVRYFKKVNLPVVITSVIVLIANTILHPDFINNSIQTTYVGIASFLILVFVSKYLDCQPIRYISSVISKYSYAIFLVHHVIILRVADKIDLVNITRTDSYLLFFLCVLCIAAVSRATVMLHQGMMNCIEQMFGKKMLDRA